MTGDKDDFEPLIPESASTGIVWPALPGPSVSSLLALAYQIDQSQWWPAAVLRRLQLQQAHNVVVHAANTVPYYRDRLASLARMRPGDLTWERFREIPILRRTDVQDAGRRLASTRYPKDHGPASEIRSSGSTGRPISVGATGVTRLYYQALNLRYHLSHKRDLTAKCASITFLGGKLSEDDLITEEKSFAGGFVNAGRAVNLHVFAPTSKQLDWLIEQDADYLLTYPSNLRALLRLSAETGKKPRKLRQVCSMTEVLDPAVREACREIWGVSVVESYSAQEAGYIAIQCPEQPGLHVQAENLIVEILDDDDQPCAPGESGRVVVTTLHNFITPLIRYEVGDYAEAGSPCACGRGLPVLNRVLGRVRNMLVLPSGEQAWPSVGGFRVTDIAPIRQLQCIQKSLEEIEVKLVPERDLTAEEQEDLRALFSSRFNDLFRITLTLCDEIPRSARGKYEDFRSEVAV